MALLSILSNLLPKADKIIDEVITSKEEALKLRNELRQIISDEEAIIIKTKKSRKKKAI